MKTHGKKKKFILRFSILIFLIFFWFSFPRPLFNDPYSTLLLDRNLELLGAKLAGDEQWRFPESEKVPEKFKKAILSFEDQYFYYHPGINPVSTCRALYQYISEGRIISGGSTLTMQVIRLSRKNKSRNIFEKMIEMFYAFRMECSYSKSEILALYASHAPFGGNVVGLDAASWRYFGVDAGKLSWAQAVTLAVLPNSPALIYPGKNHEKLLAKRNKLLVKLYKEGEFDQATLSLALSEPLPEKPYPLPQIAPHLLVRAVQEGNKGIKITSTVYLQLQENVNKIIELHEKILEANEIHNAAALVLDVNTGSVLAYTGNTGSDEKKEYSNDVDIILSPRSTGSILKPYLYAAMLNDGLLLPTTLVPDIPMQLGGFIPENYNRTYDGAVPAKRALARSLNIPAVKMLQSYDYNKFYSLLKKLGITTLTKPADHYGLSLILGGAEASLWDLAGIYASMARTLNHFNLYGKYNKDD
ncbi:MAG: penicillin-binding protein 1C, partial [Bacteroidota bacterium]